MTPLGQQNSCNRLNFVNYFRIFTLTFTSILASVLHNMFDRQVNLTLIFQVLIKNMLYGTADAEPQTDYIVAQLSQELYNSNLLLLLIQVLEFYTCLLSNRKSIISF